VTALERARDALRAGDDHAALAALLDAWGAARSARIAELIDRLDRRVRRERPAISGTSQAARHASWIERAHGDDPADIGPLLDLLSDGYPARARERISLLVGRAPDPRISAALVALIAQPPDVAWVRPASIALWDVLFGALDQHRDARSARALEAMAWLEHERAPSPFTVPRVRNRVEKLAWEYRARNNTEPELAAADRVACDELAPLIGEEAGHGAQLLAAVYADPSDRNARSVYADWLIAQNDPRGEFIALQLARGHDDPPTLRERQLLDAHGKVWLGALAATVGHREFRGGFLFRLTLDTRAPIDPMFATVVDLQSSLDTAVDVAYVADPVFRALRNVGTFEWPALRALARITRPLPFELVRVASDQGDAQLAAELEPDFDLPLPALHTMEFTTSDRPLTPAELHELFATPLVRRLRVLRVGWAGDAIARWAELFARRSNLERLVLRWNQFWRFALVRDTRGVTLEAHVTSGGCAADAAELIPVIMMETVGWLTHIATETTTAIDVVELTDSRWPDDSPRAAEVVAALGRLTGREVARVSVPRPPSKRRRR
jgi:uncharacterized protein (TIGR02996 family)